MQNRFKITKQYGRGPETPLDMRFAHLKDAQAWVNEKLIEDVALNVQATYRIYDLDEVVSELDSTKIDVSTLKAACVEGDSGAQGKGSAASFRPTPLNMSPRPAGTPQRWNVDREDEDEKK